MESRRKIITIILFGIFIVFGLLISCTDSVSSSADGRGACSSHGGVNCAAGADSDGSVICHDGWEDSSVEYYKVCH